jgi:hypothetical protein
MNFNPESMSLPHRILGSTAAIALAVALGGAAPVSAAPVIELEADGTIVNNTPGTAQIISAFSFTPNVDPEVFGNLPTATILGAGGDLDIDFYQFMTTGGTAYFDIDDDPFTFDTILSLFDSMGTLIAYDDDSFPEDPGTAFGFDSFLGAIVLAPGGYYLAVTQFANFPTTNFSGAVPLTRPDGEFGGEAIFGAEVGNSSFFTSGPQAGADYVLHISINGPVPAPEPATVALLGSGVIGLVLTRRRRKPA